MHACILATALWNLLDLSMHAYSRVVFALELWLARHTSVHRSFVYIKGLLETIVCGVIFVRRY